MVVKITNRKKPSALMTTPFTLTFTTHKIFPKTKNK